MGMRKISKRAERAIVEILTGWPAKKRLTWEALRVQIGKKLKSTDVWTRQSLSANGAIRSAFDAAKSPDAALSGAPKHSRSWYAKRVAELERTVDDLAAKLDTLRLRHMQLTYNASLLPGGTRLLADPLPNNTRMRRGEVDLQD